MSPEIEKEDSPPTMIAFAGENAVAEGTRKDVAKKLAQYLAQKPETNFLIFDKETSAPVEIDLRGSVEEVLARLKTAETLEEKAEKSGPGRPKLGVVSREIGLLPRHWEWLAQQAGGASVTLRKLVEEARKANQSQDEKRRAQNAAYKFLSAMAGNFPHYEEALRAFFAGDKALFETLSHAWPKDVRNHALTLAQKAFFPA